MARILVLGAGFGGVNVCLNLMGSGHDVRLLDMKGHHEYTPGLIDLYRDRVEDEELMIDLNDLFGDTEITFSREKVESIYPDSKMVETNAGTHEYDEIVVALGSEPKDYGMDLSEAYSPYSMEETKKIKEEVLEAEKTCVIGSGYVGVEVSGEIAGKTDLTVIEGATRPMPNSSEKAGHLALNYFNKKGISFSAGKRVKEIKESEILMEDGSTVKSDLTVWSGGIRANKVVRDSFECDNEGICVDSTLRSEQYPDVHVLGDSADLKCVKTAHNAMDQAKIVANNVGARKSELKPFKDSIYPLMVSMGNTGMMVYGKRAYTNIFFRKAKDMVFRGYKASLKAKKKKNSIL